MPMIRGTVHDLVQWIVALENDNAQLRQALEQAQAQIPKLTVAPAEKKE